MSTTPLPNRSLSLQRGRGRAEVVTATDGEIPSKSYFDFFSPREKRGNESKSKALENVYAKQRFYFKIFVIYYLQSNNLFLGVYQCYVIFQKICSYKIRQPTFFGKRRVLDSLDCNLIRNSCYVACFSCRQLMESVSLFLFRKSRGGCHFEDHLKALSYFA